ncbi:MAG: hypothetical protein CMP20_12345 [Rickettsiales bacterium]|nr:hypothetical protein [Rickettsiales bacterium]
MSRAYRNSSDVPLDAIIKRLHELSDAVVGGRKTQAQEFVMRIPAECDHDADLVLAEAAVRLDALRKYNAELQAENERLRKANQACVACEEACKADLDRALARVAELRNLCERLQHCAKGFYVDQGDYGHMEAIMKDYHWIMRASKPWRDAFVSRIQAEAVDRAAMNFGGRDYAEVRLRLSEWAQSLRQQVDEADRAGRDQ